MGLSQKSSIFIDSKFDWRLSSCIPRVHSLPDYLVPISISTCTHFPSLKCSRCHTHLYFSFLTIHEVQCSFQMKQWFLNASAFSTYDVASSKVEKQMQIEWALCRSPSVDPLSWSRWPLWIFTSDLIHFGLLHCCDRSPHRVEEQYFIFISGTIHLSWPIAEFSNFFSPAIPALYLTFTPFRIYLLPFNHFRFHSYLPTYLLFLFTGIDHFLSASTNIISGPQSPMITTQSQRIHFVLCSFPFSLELIFFFSLTFHQPESLTLLHAP